MLSDRRHKFQIIHQDSGIGAVSALPCSSLHILSQAQHPLKPSQMASMLKQHNIALPARAVARPTVAVHALKEAKKVVRPELALLAPLLAAQPAFAAETEPVDTAIETVIGAVKATGDVLKGTLSTVEAGVKVLKEGYDVAAPVVDSAIKAATPVVEQVVRTTADVATPAIKAALPALKDATKALDASGLNTKAVADATTEVTALTSTAVTQATPVLNKFVQFLQSTDPIVLGEYALGLVAFSYLAPGILGLVGGSFRGYAGELAPAAALDLLVNDGSSALVDIRTAKEKENSGVPDLPGSVGSRALEVEYAVTEDKKLRGALRDPTGIEAQITALQIASLKKLGKGTKIVLLDRNGPAARTVAKELNRKGYSRVYVLQGGFDGRGGWVQSKLQIKPAANIFSTAPPSIAKTVFTRKALPAAKSS